MASPRRTDAPIFELNVSLRDVQPPIWRRLRVSADTPLTRLHRVLQLTMGWEELHDYCFEVGDARYGVPDPELPGDMLDARGVRLRQIVPDVGMSCVYEYDFGDWWLHDLRLEKILPADRVSELPLCIEGARACPPEGCGGTAGYEEFVAAIGDPQHPEHAAMFAWRGAPYNPDWFDVRAVNDRLAGMR